MPETSEITREFLFDYPECVVVHICNNCCPDDYYCYRITKNNPSQHSDFIPQRFSQPSRRFPSATACYGISVFTCIQSAIDTALKFPVLGNLIHSGQIIQKIHGYLTDLPKDKAHKDWYPLRTVQPELVVCKHEYTCP